MKLEGVGRALRILHRTLVPGGCLIDLHPKPPGHVIYAEEKKLGRVDDREFSEIVRRAERALDAAELFVLETEITFALIDRFDTLEELQQRRWMGSRIPKTLAAHMASARSPLDSRSRYTLRRYRAR